MAPSITRIQIAIVIMGIIGTVSCNHESQITTLQPSVSQNSPVILHTSLDPSLTFPLAIEDSNGSILTLESPPERIISIDSAAVEILFGLGEGDRLVGVHDFVTYPAEAQNIPKVGGAFALDLEQIVALEPDLIYTFFDSLLPQLQDLSVPVLYLESASTLPEVADRIRLWGQIVGKATEGQYMAEEFLAAMDALKSSLVNVEHSPRLYHDEAPGWWTSGSGSLADEIYVLLKGENVFADVSGFKQITPEELVSRNPEVIITVHHEGRNLLMREIAFKDVAAVRDGRILSINGDLLAIPGPRLVQGAQQIAHFLYPNLH